jgi:type IV secretory pathway protease TraF
MYVLAIVLFVHYCSSYIKYTYNNTTSEKPGLYILYPARISSNNIYQICLDDFKESYIKTMMKLGLTASVSCNNPQISLLKTIVALPGDLVQITNFGVMINNKLLPTSTGIRIYKNIELNPLPIGYERKLQDNEYWLYGFGATSYDSRYYGPVNPNNIKNKAILVYSNNLTD